MSNKRRYLGSESAFLFGTVGLVLATGFLYLLKGPQTWHILAIFRTPVLAGLFVFYLEAWVAGGHWTRWLDGPAKKAWWMGGLGAFIGLTDGILAAGVMNLILEPDAFAEGIVSGILLWVVKPWAAIMLYGGLPASILLGMAYARRVREQMVQQESEERS